MRMTPVHKIETSDSRAQATSEAAPRGIGTRFMRRRCGAHDKSPLCFGSMWHVPALFFTPCCRVAWSIAYHLLTTYQNTILSSTHTPAPAVVHTTVHALCIHFQHHPHPHATSHSRNTEAGAVKYTSTTPFPEDSKKQPGTPASFKCDALKASFFPATVYTREP